MAILFPPHNMKFHHTKCFRRNATAVMAGTFDIRPPRDVLTSLLNGVGLYKAVERDEEARHKRKRGKREREKERRRSKAAARALHIKFTKHLSVTQMSTRLLMGILLVQVPYRSRYLRRLLHFGALGQLYIFLLFNAGLCRLRLHQHPLQISPPVRHLVPLSHPVYRVPRPRDHVHRQTTRLSALSLSIISPHWHSCPLHVRRRLQ